MTNPGDGAPQIQTGPEKRFIDEYNNIYLYGPLHFDSFDLRDYFAKHDVEVCRVLYTRLAEFKKRFDSFFQHSRQTDTVYKTLLDIKNNTNAIIASLSIKLLS